MSSTKTETRARILETTWQLMEQQHGQNVHMSHIAKAAGVSRQAVYLHFASRTELMVATMQYVDEEKGLNQRLDSLQTASDAVELLEGYVEVWGNYIPEIYGLAKALLSTRDTDEATAAAWNNSMACLRDGCQTAVAALYQEGKLIPDWSQENAAEILYTMLSIYNWEQLTIESGWTNAQYVNHMKTLLRRTLVDGG